jgi:hypothetical protein
MMAGLERESSASQVEPARRGFEGKVRLRPPRAGLGAGPRTLRLCQIDGLERCIEDRLAINDGWSDCPIKVISLILLTAAVPMMRRFCFAIEVE